MDNAEAFLQFYLLTGLGHHKANIFVCVGDGLKKKKISFKTATVLSVLSVTQWYSKMEFSKEESGYQSGCLADVPVKSPQKSHEVTRHCSIVWVPFSGPCL